MVKYVVMVKLNYPYDSYHGEYSGVYYTDIRKAEKELKEARKIGKSDRHFDYAYIETIEG